MATKITTISGEQIKPHDNLKLAEDHKDRITGLSWEHDLKFATDRRKFWKPYDVTISCIWKTESNDSRKKDSFHRLMTL